MNITLVNPGSDTLAIEKNFFSNADYDFTMTPLTGSRRHYTSTAEGRSKFRSVSCTQARRQDCYDSNYTNIPHTFNTPTRDTSAFFVNITGTGVPFGHLCGYRADTVPVSAVGTKLCWEIRYGIRAWRPYRSIVQPYRGQTHPNFTYSGLTFPLQLQTEHIPDLQCMR